MNAADDEKKRGEAEARNIAEQLLYTAEKSLKDGGDKVPADIKSDVEAKIADIKKAKEGTDIEAIKKATDFLSVSMQKIGEAMMKAQQAAGAAGAAAGGSDQKPPEGGETVKDAEFTEKK